MHRRALSLLLLLFVCLDVRAADLVRIVKAKISAGDLASGQAYVEDYKLATGVDAEYLDAIGWLARGAQMLGREPLARQYVDELRRAIPSETKELLVPLGAAIEVEGKMIAASSGRGAALRFFAAEFAKAQAPALQSRIRKNMNLLSLEGSPAPGIGSRTFTKPTLLFFFAEWCGDCKAQAASLARVWAKYKSRGLDLVAVTRLYDEPGTQGEERLRIAKVWKEAYPGLEDVPVVINPDVMIRYGASATPTFALVDAGGTVRMYMPTRLSEAALSSAIEEVLVSR